MKKSLALSIAWRLYGIPYKWGGDDPTGFDCSGFCVEILKSVGVLPMPIDLTAQGLYNMFNANVQETPSTGCLVFYGKNERAISHVMFSISNDFVIGATGGNRNTKKLDDAIRQNAFVKIRPFDYRKDVIAIVDPFHED